MEKEQYYPDFESWKKNAIKVDGLTFAPEDFYVLDKQGRKKEFFTWYEAMEYEEKILKPNGWRLPTENELQQVCRAFIYDLQKARSCLHLGLNGLIWPEDMDKYNSTFDAPIGHGVVSFGGYWSCTEYSGWGAHSLHLNSSETLINCNDKFHGFSVRCVSL